jgi:hypothetical protein
MPTSDPSTTAIFPRPLYVAKLAAGTALGIAAVSVATGFDPALVVVGVALVLFAWWLFRLKLSPDGVRIAMRFQPWSQVVIERRSKGDVLRSRDGIGGWGRFAVLLSNYEADWRSGRIGDAIGRWWPERQEAGLPPPPVV